MDHKNKIPGITLEEERKMLADIIAIADENLNKMRASVQTLAEDMQELKEVYDVEDKEGLAQWFNTDARLKQAGQELLRAERSRKKPYFGRIDFTEAAGGPGGAKAEETGLPKPECYYIGKSVIAKDAAAPEVIDWRAPIASVYYEKALGACTYSVKGEGAFAIELSRKRTYEIEKDELKDFYDSDVVANDELLTKYLAKNKRAVLSEIIATIQQEQNDIIRRKPQHNMIVQGGAGSGKTTVAMHRISYILYNYEMEFRPQDFYIIDSNRILLNYITGILPDLDVYGALQMTMEQLFTRLLYEDWDEKRFTVKKLNKADQEACIKGSLSWFRDLEEFCRRYEWDFIPREDIYIEKTHRLLMSRNSIEKLLKKYPSLSLSEKRDKLTEYLMAQVENEIYGRYYTYPPQEQKSLLRYYQAYFGKREWKGSVFELYDDFLREQNAKGHPVLSPGASFDLYDLAALAYLYKRIKETQVIQEASHVVIDEAQDFGMMAYSALNYCLSKCTYTIMGDVSQNIYFGYGLTDWEELRSLMLPGEFDYFGILRKSYRNTVEISNFATNILQHGNFPVYPVEPIIRHGNEVLTVWCDKEEQLIAEAAGRILNWQKMGYETIAVICAEEKEAGRVAQKLGRKVRLREFNAQTEDFGNGVMVIPIEYSKGLEFDAVLIFNANEKNYPALDGYVKLLYVAATRALHELAVLYQGKLTQLIAAPVPEEKKQKVLAAIPKPAVRYNPGEDSRTNREIEMERAREGHREMALRSKIGPRRVSAQNLQSHTKETITPKASATASVLVKPVKKAETGHPKSSVKKQTESIEFGLMPDSTSLRPLGHSGFNLSIRWIRGNKNYLELTNAYGILRITPIAEHTVQISCAREPFSGNAEIPAELLADAGVSWRYREIKDQVEVMTARLLLRVDKKTGAISFYTAGEKLLLSENTRFPRQIEKLPKSQTWTYFDWTKKEVLKARGAKDEEWLEMNNTAKFISIGGQSSRPACLMSNNGYQLFIPADRRVMCCTIAAYGAYLYTEGTDRIDYFFRTVF